MAHPDGVYNGNGKYKKEMCERVIQLYKNGESDVEVAAALNISKSMFYRWIKDPTKAEFAEAVEKGKTLSEVWWQRLGRAGAAGKVPIQARVFIANMRNRFGWVENALIDDAAPPNQQNKNVEIMAEALQAIKDKYAKPY